MKPRQVLIVLLAAIIVAACTPDEAALPETTAPPTTVDTATTTLPAPTTTLPPTTRTATVAPATTVAEPREVEGVVIAVEGGLRAIDSFTVLVGSGEQMTFDPVPGLLFDGGPLSHLREHLLDGVPVYVIYTVEPDGTNVAIEVGDAS